MLLALLCANMVRRKPAALAVAAPAPACRSSCALCPAMTWRHCCCQQRQWHPCRWLALWDCTASFWQRRRVRRRCVLELAQRKMLLRGGWAPATLVLRMIMPCYAALC